MALKSSGVLPDTDETVALTKSKFKTAPERSSLHEVDDIMQKHKATHCAWPTVAVVDEMICNLKASKAGGASGWHNGHLMCVGKSPEGCGH